MVQENRPGNNPDVCLRCASCQAVCPVSRVSPHFPGPKQAGPGVQRFRTPGEASTDGWVDLCIGCRLCDLVCPSGVNISELNLMAKAKYLDEKGRPIRDWLLTHSYLFGRVGSLFTWAANPILKSTVFKWVLDVLLKIDKRRDMPAYQSPTFREWFKGHTFKGYRKVAFFHGCYVNTNEIDVGKAAVRVLEAYGFEVILPPQTCCGVPMLGNGDFKRARKMGSSNVSSLGRTVRSGLDIVFSSTSCGHMIRHEYKDLLSIPGAEEVAEHTFDIFEFLKSSNGAHTTKFKELPLKAAYFAPCHLRSMGIGFPSFEILQGVPGLHIDFIDADCCGLGGTFGFKRERYDLSEEIGKDLAQVIDRLRPEIVLSDCEGCRMQIRHLTGLKVLHPIQVLRDALS